MHPRYDAGNLLSFAQVLLERAELPSDRAAAVAEILVEGDLLGHTTHGLQLLASYLKELAEGGMSKTGEPLVIRDRGSAVTWDGNYLPGPWLTLQAMELAFRRLIEIPVVTVVIRRSHHIACLQAYLRRATDRGWVMLLMSSDPNCASVAPHGGRTPVYTPNPFAAGFPTDGDPVLMDVSMSTTTNGMAERLYGAGRRLPGNWLTDNQGRASDDPAVLFTEPPGAILPLGQLELGHKGFALGLLVEALTASLGGFGRSDQPGRWGASVFLQIMDPEAFGGRESFKRESGWLARACCAAEALPGGAGVRLPGQAGLARRAGYLQHGVELAPTIMPALKPWADKWGVATPQPI